MRAHLEFITVPTADTPGTALYLAFDKKRYLIGQIGEGIQRACVQDGFGMKKVQEVLVTGNATSQSTGGLIGMILTLADVIGNARADEEEQKKKKKKSEGPRSSYLPPTSGGVDEGLVLSLYGPQNLAGTLAAARKFVFRKGMPIKVHEIRSGEADRNFADPSWSDDNLKVWTFAVTPEAGERKADESPRNSLKRTFDEANQAEVQWPGDTEYNGQRQDENDQIRHGIIADMFGSKWRMDTLVERRLDEVKMPAKMWVRNPDTRKLDEYKGPLPGGAEPLPNPMPVVLTRNPWPGALVNVLPPTSPYKAAVSYIIVRHPRRGKFDVKKAAKLPIGKHDYGPLSKGQNVVGSDGSTITPAMVLGPEYPGNGVAIIDLPSLEYVQDLVDRPEWHVAHVADHLGAIIWILGRGVAESPVLRKFMEARRHMEHIVSGPDFVPNSLAFDSVSTSAIKLATVDMTTFPVPHHDNKFLPQRSSSVPLTPVQPLPAFVRVAKRGQRVQMDPDIKVLEDQVKEPLDTLSLIRENNSQELMDLAQAARTAFQAPGKVLETEAWVSQVPLPDVEITTLGTGSALPSKYRNVSSTLVRVPGQGSYLFDAGENTIGSLRRVFNPAELEEVLRDLRMIWISHLHADHHLGTSSVIKAWHQVVHPNNTAAPISNSILDEIRLDAGRGKDLRGRYLTVVSGHDMLQYLSEYDHIENFGYSHIIPLRVHAANFNTKTGSSLVPFHRHLSLSQAPVGSEVLRALMGVEDLQAALVSHCHGAMAVSVTFPVPNKGRNGLKDPFKVSYSGDCRPSHEFAKIGHDSTVLIHEATFEDELHGEARAKKHSTVSEALGVGSLMRAKAVVLTHFSQRYSKIPIVDGFWNDRSDVEKAIERGEEEQDRLQIDDGEDEIRGIQEEEEMQQKWTPKPRPIIERQSNNRPAVAAASFFDQPLGPLEGGDKKHDMKVAIAFDYMKFKLRNLPRMEAFRPALAKLFEEDIGSETSVKVKENKKMAEQKEITMKEFREKEKQWREKNQAENGNGASVATTKIEEAKVKGPNEKKKTKAQKAAMKKATLVAVASETLVEKTELEEETATADGTANDGNAQGLAEELTATIEQTRGIELPDVPVEQTDRNEMTGSG